VKSLTAAALTATLLCMTAPAHAQDATPSEDPSAPFPATQAMEPSQLNAVTGKAEIAMAINANNTSEVSNNVVSGNSVTGTISFDGSSFDNLHGLSVLSANTGNNVAINASMNINVAIRP